MKKAIIYGIVFLLFASFAFAESEQIFNKVIDCSESGYYVCDDFEGATLNSSKFQNNGDTAVNQGAGKLNCGTTAQTDCVSTVFNGFDTGANFCVLYKLNASGNNYILQWIGTSHTWDSSRNTIFSYTSNPGTEWKGYWKNLGTAWGKTESNIGKNVTIMECFTSTGAGNVSVYYDNVLKNFSSTTSAWETGQSGMRWGSRNYQNTYVSISYFMAWNGTLGDAPFLRSAPVSPNFQLTLTGKPTYTPLTTFNASIGGTTYATTNGTIVTNLLQNATQLYNITYYAKNYETWTYNNINVSSNYLGYVNYSVYLLNVSATAIIEGKLTNFNVTVNGSLYKTTNGSILVETSKNTYLSVSCNLPGYLSNTSIIQIVNITQDLNFSLDWDYFVLNVSAVAVVNGKLTIFNVSVNDSIYNTTNGTILINTPRNAWLSASMNLAGYVPNSSYFQITNRYQQLNFSLDWDHYNLNVTAKAGGITQILNFSVTAVNGSQLLTGSTSNGYILFNASKNTAYLLTIDAQNYAYSNASIYVNSYLTNYSFSLYATNSIYFKFYDDKLNIPINWQTVRTELISDLYSNNYTVSNGSLYVSLLVPEAYTIRYTSPGYYENFYYFTLINGTVNNLTLYLLNATEGTETTATVYDSTGRTVSDAYIRTLRYDITTNSYILVGQAKTNFEGTTKLYLVQNTEFYKFLIYYPADVFRKETSPTYIYSNTVNFQISLDEGIGSAYYSSLGISNSLIFNEATNNFRLTFSNANALSNQVCLEIERARGLNSELINSTCVMTSSGTVLLEVYPQNGTTYNAKAYVYIDGTKIFINGASKSYTSLNPAGNMGLFAIILLTIIAAFLFLFSVPIALIVVPIPTMLGASLGLISLSPFIGVGLEVLAVMLAIMLHKEG